jgi:hypothetical protein
MDQAGNDGGAIDLEPPCPVGRGWQVWGDDGGRAGLTTWTRRRLAGIALPHPRSPVRRPAQQAPLR